MLYEMSMEERAEIIQGSPPSDFPTATSKQLNWDLENHPEARAHGFREAFLSEVAGQIDASLQDIVNATEAIARFQGVSGGASVDSARDLRNTLCSLFALEKMGTDFPEIRIHAGLFAAVRVSHRRKFKPNDLFDFHHASLALAYCDFFFSDNPMVHLLSTPPLEYDKLYETLLASDPAHALTLLKENGMKPRR